MKLSSSAEDRTASCSDNVAALSFHWGSPESAQPRLLGGKADSPEGGSNLRHGSLLGPHLPRVHPSLRSKAMTEHIQCGKPVFASRTIWGGRVGASPLQQTD